MVQAIKTKSIYKKKVHLDSLVRMYLLFANPPLSL